jgi:uncharacterized membrane protein HdeD (DUF308 family)
MWGAIVFRGVVALLFGIAAVFWPHLTLVTLVYLFGVYVLVTGIMNEIVGLTNFSGVAGSAWGRILLIIIGAAEVGVGIYFLRHPHVAFATFILVAGLTFIVRGLFELFTGVFGEGGGAYRTFMIIGGILAVLAGIIILVQPVAGGIAFVWVMGLYALVYGPMLIALGFEAKNLGPGAVAARTARAAR